MDQTQMVKWPKVRASRVLFAICIIFTVLSIRTLMVGMDKKDHYHYVEYSDYNVNAYVGGDAYNYIINGTYFSGYCALTAGYVVSATLTGCTGIYLSNKEKELKEES